jgi:hypothetical protein
MALNLNDVPDFEGLPVGEHTVKVTAYEGVTNHSTGNEGFMFKVEDQHGRKHRVTIWTTKDNGQSPNLISLKRFAKACGLKESEMARWEPNVMQGRYFLAHVEVDKRNPQYTVIDRFDPSPLQKPTAAAAPAPPPQPAVEDQLPF